MKKFVGLMLSVVLLLSTISCGMIVSNNDAEGVFFPVETLEKSLLGALPQPPLHTARLRGDTLYLKLTEEETQAYFVSLRDFLLLAEGLHHVSYVHSSFLKAEFFPYDVCAPLTADHAFSGSVEFVFSKSATLGEDGDMAEPVRITLARGEEKTLSGTEFTYNVRMRLRVGAIRGANLNLCAAKHTFGEAVRYPVAGTELTVGLQACVHCGFRELTDKYGNGEEYTVSVAEGSGAWLRETLPTRAYSGSLVEVKVAKVADRALTVLVNGTPAKWMREDSDGNVYAFVMHNDDAVITVTDGSDSEE
ncbi:MAG: hypothetical protein E7620_03300 [Ruminococcaceae bacterium]|nr:hypothetical protein [Oscillospiraceae bacterium]